MNDADDSLELLVRLKSDTAGAGATTDAIKGITGAAEASNATIGKSAGAHEEAGKAAEKHSAHLRGMHKIFHSLNEIVPGLGALMQAAFSPVGAAISIAVIAMRAFAEHTKKVNEELKRMEEENAKPLTQRLEAMRAGTVSLASAQAELRERLEHTAHSERGVREEIEKTLEAQKRQIELAREVADANKEKELAGLEALHTAGLLSDERYFAAKLAAEEKYRKRKRELEEAEEMRGILAQNRALELAEMREPELKAATDAAVRKREAAKVDLDSLPTMAKIEEDKKKAEAALKSWDEKHGPALDKARADVQRDISLGYDKPDASDAEAFGLNINRAAVQQLEDQRKTLQGIADMTAKQWKEAPDRTAEKTVALSRASGEAERALKREEESRDLVEEYRRTGPEKRAAFNERRSANQETDASRNDEAREKLKGTAAGAAIAGGAEALQRLMGGGHFNPTKEQDVSAMNGLLALARMLDTLPSHEPGKPEPRSAAGVNFGRAVSSRFRDTETDLAQQGIKVDQATRQANAEVAKTLSGLHGLAADILRVVAANVGDTGALARELEHVKKIQRDQQSQISGRGLNAGG